MPKEIERKQRQQKMRSSRELNKKHKFYSNAMKELKKNNHGKIPAIGTNEGNLYHRYSQAMKAIEELTKNKISN